MVKHKLCPQLRRSWRGILVSCCACVLRASGSSRTVHASVLKLAYMDFSLKNSWHTFFFLSELSSFLELCPFFKKIRMNLMHAISYEPCKLAFWNLYMDSSWKIAWADLFSCPSYRPFWSYTPLKTSEWNLVSKISQKVFELGVWNLISW